MTSSTSLATLLQRSVSSPAMGRLRPSPERLEAQVRSLAMSQDSVVKALVDELKESRKQIQMLQVHQFSFYCWIFI